MPFFSVIIPTFNRADLLREALASVFSQTFKDYEVIVVDDGSTDATEAILSSYSGRIRSFWQQNAGPGTARNLGARQAMGTYLAFLDGDDLWFSWTLEFFARTIRECRGPAIISGSIVEFAVDHQLAKIRETPGKIELFVDYLAAFRKGYYVGSGNAVIRRQDFMNAGGFTDKRINGEDHDLILRLGTAAGYVHANEPPTLGYRRHSSSVTRIGLATFEGMIYLAQQEKNGRYPGGSERATARRSIISMHMRSFSIGFLAGNMASEAWQLYRTAFWWHLQLGRWKYLLGFPAKAAVVGLRRVFSRSGAQQP